MSLTPDQIERYKRHILLPEIGGQGQQALTAVKVLVIGAGGLGCPILQYLTAAGIGTIAICDGDKVSLSNLQRQTLYRTDDIGKSKVTCAITALKKLNPDVRFLPFKQNLTEIIAAKMIAPFDLVIEGVDRFTVRFMINQACLETKTPMLSSAIGRFDGQVAMFAPWRAEDQPCYRCLVPETPGEKANCETEGVLGAVPGIIGAYAAMRAVLWLSGVKMTTDEVTIFDGLGGTMRSVTLKKDPACPGCL